MTMRSFRIHLRLCTSHTGGAIKPCPSGSTSSSHFSTVVSTECRSASGMAEVRAWLLRLAFNREFLVKRFGSRGLGVVAGLPIEWQASAPPGAGRARTFVRAAAVVRGDPCEMRRVLRFASTPR